MDHAFIGCTTGAPEADALLQLGFVEGSGNTHPGQGTANRRFFFENFMLELLWVSDFAAVNNERTRRTRLCERCVRRDAGVNPFGIIFRSIDQAAAAAPFATWDYMPVYLPPGLALQIAQGTTLHEPELFYMPFMSRAVVRSTEPLMHALPIRRIRGLSSGVRDRAELSAAALAAERHGLLHYFESRRPLLEIVFEGPMGLNFDLRPGLPLLFRSTSI